jgi:hypothetical protein
VWSAACGQAAEDLELLSSRHLPRRRREAPLELRVLARPLLEVRRARPRARLGLGLEGVLLAGVLCGRGVRWAALAALGGLSERKLSESLGRSRGVTRRLCFSREVSRLPPPVRSFGSPGVCLETSRRLAAARGAVFLPVAMTLRSRRQRLWLQDLSQAFTLRLRDGLVWHLSRARRFADLLASNHALSPWLILVRA